MEGIQVNALLTDHVEITIRIIGGFDHIMHAPNLKHPIFKNMGQERHWDNL